jgi:hypothetical protein
MQAKLGPKNGFPNLSHLPGGLPSNVARGAGEEAPPVVARECGTACMATAARRCNANVAQHYHVSVVVSGCGADSATGAADCSRRDVLVLGVVHDMPGPESQVPMLYQHSVIGAGAGVTHHSARSHSCRSRTLNSPHCCAHACGSRACHGPWHHSPECTRHHGGRLHAAGGRTQVATAAPTITQGWFEWARLQVAQQAHSARFVSILLTS